MPINTLILSGVNLLKKLEQLILGILQLLLILGKSIRKIIGMIWIIFDAYYTFLRVFILFIS